MAYPTQTQLTEGQKQKIIDALRSHGAIYPCPRCGNQSFTLIDGYFNQPLQVDLGGLVIGGRSIPSVVTACQRCGFLAQHALGALGLLPPEGEKR